MRIIKFRLIYKGEIVGYEWHDDSEEAIHIWQKVPDGVWFNMRYFPDKHIVHDHKDQCIGYKDKNGIEIYEGDKTNYGIIEWCNDLTWDTGGSRHPGFYFKDKYDHGQVGELSYHDGFDADIEII